jgi:O-antigen/teichoic acid export membrane protein
MTGKRAEMRSAPVVSRLVGRLVGAFAGSDGLAGDAKAQRTVVLGTLGSVSLNVVTLLANFVLAVVLARTLGTARYGTYAVALAWSVFLAVPATVGLPPLVVRRVAASMEREEWGLLRGIIRFANRTVTVSSTAIVGLAAVTALVLRDEQPDLVGPFLVGLLLVPITALTLLRHAAIQGLHRVVLARLPDTIVMPVTFLAVVLVAGWMLGDRFTAVWAIALNVFAAGVAFIVGTVLLWRVLPGEVWWAEPDFERRNWVRSALPFVGISMLLTINNQLGTILLGTFADSEAAGMFSVAMRVAMFTSFMFLAATYPLYPNVARLWAAEDTDAIQHLLTRTVRVVTIFSIVIALGLCVFANEILAIFGSEFSEAATAFRILVVAELAKAVLGFGGIVLVMTTHERSMARATAVGVTLNLAIAIALIPVWGVDGAAVASAVSTIASGMCIVWFAWRRLGVYAPAIGSEISRHLKVSE